MDFSPNNDWFSPPPLEIWLLKTGHAHNGCFWSFGYWAGWNLIGTGTTPMALLIFALLMCKWTKDYHFDALFDAQLGIYYYLRIASLANWDLLLTDFECFPYWVPKWTAFGSKNQTFPLDYQLDFWRRSFERERACFYGSFQSVQDIECSPHQDWNQTVKPIRRVWN